MLVLIQVLSLRSSRYKNFGFPNTFPRERSPRGGMADKKIGSGLLCSNFPSRSFCLVRVVGLEPTLFRTRPLNVRVLSQTALLLDSPNRRIKSTFACLFPSPKIFIKNFGSPKTFSKKRSPRGGMAELKKIGWACPSRFLFLVRVVGLEPTLFRTRPLNVRVCHSATLANRDLIIIHLF